MKKVTAWTRFIAWLKEKGIKNAFIVVVSFILGLVTWIEGYPFWFVTGAWAFGAGMFTAFNWENFRIWLKTFLGYD